MQSDDNNLVLTSKLYVLTAAWTNPRRKHNKKAPKFHTKTCLLPISA